MGKDVKDAGGLGDGEPKVLWAMLDEPLAWHCGLGLCDIAGLAAGSIYPALARLEREGLLESRWEEAPSPGCARRRLYRLSGLGQRVAVASSVAAEAGPRVRRGWPAPFPRRGLA